MKVGYAFVVLSVCRFLVHDHHVRQRESEQVIVACQQTLEYARQVPSFLIVQVRYGRDAPPSVDVRFVREAGVERDKGCEVFALRQYPAAVLVLLREQVAVEAAFVIFPVLTGGFRVLSPEGAE